MTRRRTALPATVVTVLLATALWVAGCSRQPTPNAQDTPTPGASEPSTTLEPPAGDSAPATPVPSGSSTPGSGATPDATATPGTTAGPVPSGTPIAVTCSTVEPVGIGRVDAGPRRVTEVATVVSDGRTLTTGSTEETDLLSPTLVGPAGTVVVDQATLSKIATLVAASTNHSVQLERPASPDVRADVSRRPFNSPGTYAMFNASSPLSIEVAVVCSGQQQTWLFRGEGDPARGTVNCAVEPGRGNVLGRSVYQTAC